MLILCHWLIKIINSLQNIRIYIWKAHINLKSYPITGLDRLQEIEASRISRQSAHEGGKVVSHMHRPLVITAVGGWVNPRGHSVTGRIKSMKNPMAPSGIKPVTFCLVAQYLNQFHHHVPHTLTSICQNRPCCTMLWLGMNAKRLFCPRKRCAPFGLSIIFVGNYVYRNFTVTLCTF